MNNNTRPEQRPDVNGKIVTRHVKDGTTAKAPIVVPAPKLFTTVTASPVQSLLSHANDTDFSGMEKEHAAIIAGSVASAINKDNLWDAFTVLTKAMQTTDHPEDVGASLANEGVGAKLRDAWLEAHGANLADRSYVEISGDGGYEDYNDAFSLFSAVYTSRVPQEEESAAVTKDGDLSVEVVDPGVKERGFTPTKAPATVADAYGDQLIAAGTSTDFSSMSKDETWDAITAVSNRISKDNLWDVLEVLNKGVAETSHPDSFIVALEHTKAHTKIRDTWLNMHGADIADRRTYFQIEGENGYKRYKTEYAKLAQTAAARDPRKETREP